MSFTYSESDLPEVTAGDSYTLGESSFAKGETITYYNVGGWSMSNIDVEDGDIEHARSSALAWIAWVNFLESNPDVVVKTENS